MDRGKTFVMILRKMFDTPFYRYDVNNIEFYKGWCGVLLRKSTSFFKGVIYYELKTLHHNYFWHISNCYYAFKYYNYSWRHDY